MAAGDIEVEVIGVPYHARRILRRTLGWEPDGAAEPASGP
jgi:hypothetical protein